MAQVETVRGRVDTARLGTTLMHEHVFVLNEEIRLNYPGDWDEEARVADAAAKLNALRQRGCDTIVDPTVIGLGRDIGRIQRVAAGTDLNTIVATGLYTYGDVPFHFRYRGSQASPATSDTGVKAAPRRYFGG
jgi:phosphotriesterase-related protein